MQAVEAVEAVEAVGGASLGTMGGDCACLGRCMCKRMSHSKCGEAVHELRPRDK